MKIFEHINSVHSFVTEAKTNGKTIGFVPTMGALHRGHISLVEQSIHENDITIASVFVNPTQFNNSSDLEKYPRDFEKDRSMLENIGCSAVFTPSVVEMYPTVDKRVFDFSGIDSIMEGEHRPGHFNGVAQIVSKLFDAIPANNAYFGIKDFQQLAIIKNLVQQLNLPIKIVACDIIREPDGLAMSSRNIRLSAEHRAEASLIYKTLKAAVEKSQELNKQQINQFVEQEISKSELLKLEYFEIVNSSTLTPVVNINDKEEAIGCIAVWANNIRLIDNIIFNF